MLVVLQRPDPNTRHHVHEGTDAGHVLHGPAQRRQSPRSASLQVVPFQGRRGRGIDRRIRGTDRGGGGGGTTTKLDADEGRDTEGRTTSVRGKLRGVHVEIVCVRREEKEEGVGGGGVILYIA